MKNANQIYITKASGESVLFSEAKLRNSMKRAGAGKDQVDKIIENISDKLYKGISTKKIYRIAFNMLKAGSKPVAAKYHLKRAIMELGPAGYAFEKYVGEILKYKGYQIIIGEIVAGKCVNHEIDVIAEKNEHHFMVECKYHNQPGTVCDVKIPLYIQARFKDVEATWLKIPGHEAKFHQGWVVTNTRFTGDAIQYGTCAGLKLIGWNYPDGESLRSEIDSSGLYPITCLTSISKLEKQKLLDKKIVLCRELIGAENLLTETGIKHGRMEAVTEEVHQLTDHLANRKS